MIVDRHIGERRLRHLEVFALRLEALGEHFDRDGDRGAADLHELRIEREDVAEPHRLLSIALGWSCLPANARFTGFCIGMLGDLIFLASVLCMKDSWRAGIPDKDKTELVTTGIYRYSRNPAFLGFDLMYIGMLL